MPHCTAGILFTSCGCSIVNVSFRPRTVLQPFSITADTLSQYVIGARHAPSPRLHIFSDTHVSQHRYHPIRGEHGFLQHPGQPFSGLPRCRGCFWYFRKPGHWNYWSTYRIIIWLLLSFVDRVRHQIPKRHALENLSSISLVGIHVAVQR